MQLRDAERIIQMLYNRISNGGYYDEKIFNYKCWKFVGEMEAF